MSKYARHRRTNTVVNGKEFMAIEGRNWGDAKRPRGAVWAACLSCDRDMAPRKSPLKLAWHFAHRPGVDASDCPLSTSADPRFGHLWPERWDLERGVRLRREFCAERNLKEAFNVCNKIARSVTTDEFIAMVRAADRYSIWRYSALPLEFVPYILMTLKDLIADSNAKRTELLDFRENFRYVIDAFPRQPINQLWERAGTYQLQPVFADSGKAIWKLDARDITDVQINAQRAEIAWISEHTYRKLDRELCSQRH